MPKTSLRLMSANLENLFSPGVSFYGRTYTQQEYDAKVGWIAALIANSHVHVVAVLELGEHPDQCLTDIRQAVNSMDSIGWPAFDHQFAGAASPTGARIRTGLISRFPLSGTGSLTDYPQGFAVDLFDPAADQWKVVPSTGYSRPVAYATVTPPNGAAPFNVYTVHFKSKRPRTTPHDQFNEPIGIARSAIQRNVEAAALRFYMDEFLPQQYAADPAVPTFVVGDFNDTPTSVPVENVRGPFDRNPGPGSTWSELDKRRLLNCARLHLKFTAHEDKLFSYVYNESFTLIDNVFVTEHLANRFVRLEIYNDHVFRHQDLSETTDVDRQWKSRVSDHGALVMEFSRVLRP